MLTEKQESVLRFIIDYSNRNGYPPSVREIAAHNGSRHMNSAVQLLHALEQKGYIERQRKARAIRVLREP